MEKFNRVYWGIVGTALCLWLIFGPPIPQHNQDVLAVVGLLAYIAYLLTKILDQVKAINARLQRDPRGEELPKY